MRRLPSGFAFVAHWLLLFEGYVDAIEFSEPPGPDPVGCKLAGFIFEFSMTNE